MVLSPPPPGLAVKPDNFASGTEETAWAKRHGAQTQYPHSRTLRRVPTKVRLGFRAVPFSHRQVHEGSLEGNFAILVLLEPTAAFDNVDHGILLSSREHCVGIKGTALKWFQSYLSIVFQYT